MERASWLHQFVEIRFDLIERATFRAVLLAPVDELVHLSPDPATLGDETRMI
jgi:hypothetical protein